MDKYHHAHSLLSPSLNALITGGVQFGVQYVDVSWKRYKICM